MSVLVSTGVFSRSHTAPPVASAGPGGALPVVNLGMRTSRSPSRPASTCTDDHADGRVAFDRILRAGEGESCPGRSHPDRDSWIVARAHSLTVNGHDLGAPGSATDPYEETFGPKDYGSQPSAAPSVG